MFKEQKIQMVAVITWRSRVYTKKDYSIVCCNPDDLRRAFSLVARIHSYHQIDVSYHWKQ